MKEDKNNVKKEYLKRVTKVLDYIEENLDADLSLELLSKIANYSPFHFHRVFATIIGENLNQYVIRKRIERIASILITEPEKAIKQLAYTYGFTSESSFSRAFKKYYGVSPSTFKSEGKKILSKIGIELFSKEKYIYSIDNMNKWITMNSKITITELEKIKLVGITQIGAFEKMSDSFQKLMSWSQNKSLIDPSSFKAVTIYHDNPNVTQVSKVRYSACITINKEIEADEEIRPITIEKGIYIIARFEIKAEQISIAWKNLNKWIIENEYEFRDGSFFETYHNDQSTHPENKCIIDICIPIKKSNKVTIDKSLDIRFSTANKISSDKSEGYHVMVKFMKELRAHYIKEYELDYTIGKINQSSKDYTYFSLTPEELKKIKLKFVIILDHIENQFSICLSGQNKIIRKKYWNIFNEAHWNKYHVAESIDQSLMIVDHTLVEKPNFSEPKDLIQQIEQEARIFTNEMKDLLV